MEKSKNAERAAFLISLFLTLLLLSLFFKYLFPPLLPFLIAFCIGTPIYKLSFILKQKVGIPHRLSALLLILLFVSALSSLVFICANRLFAETEELIAWLKNNSSSVTATFENVFSYIEDISSKIPFAEEIEKIEGLENFRQTVNEKFSELISELISTLTSSIPNKILVILKNTPKLFAATVVTLISCFYFAVDYGRIKEGLLHLLSSEKQKKVTHIISTLSSVLKRYIKAYLLIMLITFAQAFAGLIILGKKYAFIISALIAAVDILPVFGAGTVLIPWGIFSLLDGDIRGGSGLLILYGVITIVRQIIEPKIVGESLGLHPLATLVAMFAGLSVFGIIGMLLSPFVLICAKELYTKQL